MYGYTNKIGEPIMDGAAYRFEQQLDAESAYENSFDADYLDPRDYDEPDGDADPATCGHESEDGGEAGMTCVYCSRVRPYTSEELEFIS